MNLKNPIKQAKQIETEFSEYIKSMFDIRDVTYKQLFLNELKKMEKNLYKGPYICSSLPFEKSYSINDLVNNNTIHPNFAKLGKIDEIADRKLYKHQVDALTKIENGRNVVITTGTGSGKTECFMYPILDTIIKEVEGGNKESGVRAIFLFPLNALVNDQLKRIRDVLSTYQDITFGFYTGETPENNFGKKYNKYISLYGDKISSNELITREEIRKNPPHILFTNYSMLEYLLIRPSDANFLSPDSMKYLRYIVLDEAHTYGGALGMELSVLLRRLCGTTQRQLQYILTSATLGRGKEDTSKIIKFASNLTSSNFLEEDIIFAKRHKNTSAKLYNVKPSDYLRIYENINNTDEVNKILEQYIYITDNTRIKENIFRLLEYDSNAERLYEITKNASPVYEVRDNFLMSMTSDELVALIELISFATNADGYKLFEIKYHMFIKAPDGAFVTLGDNKKLSLTNCKTIDDKKAFKLGICQNCKTPYIIGKIENDILCIDDEIDMDENEDLEESPLEYFLIHDCLTENEILSINSDSDNYEECIVCSKCGKITSKTKKNSCDCGKNYKTILYKIKKEKESTSFTNNIKKCAICDYSTKNGGVVLGFHIGKDRATALISQILYNSMPIPTKTKIIKSMFGTKTIVEQDKKQFIAFSDARQQAAFFSKFINSNNDRILKKRLIWELLKDTNNDHNPIKYAALTDKLTEYLNIKLDFENSEAIKHGSAAALWELLNVDGRNSAEGLGIFAFQLDLPEEYDQESDINQYLKENGYNIDYNEFKTLTKVVLNVFRTTPAIKYKPLSNNISDLDDLLGYRKYTNYIAKIVPELAKGEDKAKYEKDYKNVHSFLPKNSQSSNKICKYISKVYGYDKVKAKSLLELIFETAKVVNLIEQESNGFFRIDCQKYSVHSYKKLNFYRCKKCGRTTIYNIKNQCVNGDCDGVLETIDVDEYFQNNYYRKEYMNRPIENIVTREHTAQIKSDEARKIQEDFNNKKINIISCSTTFEMGIDLGGLNTVFMRNIPPTPANYAQRAGRAGRRADSSAFVLTFCGISSHDYTFFSNPKEMIAGLVPPPIFPIENQKILVRHITASALSAYFKENVDAFESIDGFIRNDHIDSFEKFILSKNEELGSFIDKYVLFYDSLKIEYGNFKWIPYILDHSKNSLTNMIDGIKDRIKSYTTAIEELKKSDEKGVGNQIEQYKNALSALKNRNSIIQYLARYSVIPKYGFPVDNISLQIYNVQNMDFDDKYDLTRDLSIAISEYAPESEVIVDNKKYTSRYVYTPYPYAPQLITYYITCPHCDKYNLFDVKPSIGLLNCKYCNKSFVVNNSTIKHFIRPTRGFITDKMNKETKQIKPRRSYASDLIYIGDSSKPMIKEINISNTISISEYKNEELFVLNDNPFYYCSRCGYTILDKTKVINKITMIPHKDYRGVDCNQENSLIRTAFGHTFVTDVVKLEFMNVKLMMDRKTAFSVLYAILEAMSNILNIDRNDISGIVEQVDAFKPYQLVLFDTVSGGAGHVKELLVKEQVLPILTKALEIVSNCNCQEDMSCYHCLRNFRNQKVHKYLQRNLAIDAISTILQNIENSSSKLSIISVGVPIYSLDNFEFEDYVDDEESIITFKNIVKEMQGVNCALPDGYAVTISNEEGEKFNADFCWKGKNILLFSSETMESYHKLANGLSKFKCYLLNEQLNVIEFIDEIKED